MNVARIACYSVLHRHYLWIEPTVVTLATDDPYLIQAELNQDITQMAFTRNDKILMHITY